MSPEILEQQLLDRWLTAYDEMGTLPKYKEQVVETFYGEMHLFRVSDYNNGNFPAEEGLSSEFSERKRAAYGLNAAGRPCYVTSYGEWEGFYHYSESYVEYVEFHIPTRVPSCIQRLELRDGLKTAYQSLLLNGRSGIPDLVGQPKEKMLKRLLKDKHSIISDVELFHYENGCIKWADCLYNMPGIGKMPGREEYKYNEDGTLDEIVSILKDNEPQYAYVKPPAGVSLSELSDRVSQLMAADIITAIEAIKPKQPLVLLEVGYREVANYVPWLKLISERDWTRTLTEMGEEELFNELMLYNDHDYKEVQLHTAERLLKAFLGEVEKGGDYAIAETMMHRTAWYLTTGKLDRKIAASDQFIAYSVDWSLCPDDIGEMLLSCGMPETQLHDWKERGII
ncbi:hypothetical protein AB6805_21350 [Chitinophaga sp. RCC_12]|uniref:hypothetical protein n=1 Tax=Chitinophaga sp. RCC_12 TaxID=3239226 RepID=UPI0035260C67